MPSSLQALVADGLRIAPEVVLAATALVLALWGGFTTCPSRASFSLLAATGGLVAGIYAARLPEMMSPAFGGMIEVEPVGIYLRYLFLVAAVVAAVVAHVDRRLDDRHYGEFLALVLLVTAGAGILASARHLLLAYIAFEMLSVPSYALVGFVTGDRRSAEAGLKYAVYGGASSAALLFGASILYGLTGSLFYDGIREGLAAHRPDPTLVALAGVLLFAGIAFKISSAPFHWWAPDAYEGAPATVAGFLSVVPKAAGFGFLLALSQGVIGPDAAWWRRLLVVAAALTMTWGNLVALHQTNTQRMLAWSSIAHAGYMLVGVSVGTPLGTAAVLFYLTAYLLMNLGAFYVVSLVPGGERLPGFRGLGSRAPVVAVAMAIFLFSLTGLPPLGGFVGKALLFFSAIEFGGRAGYGLALFIAGNTVISLFYYAEIVRRSFLETPDPDAPALEVPRTVSYSLGLMAAGVVVLGLFWNGFAEIVRAAAGV